MAQLTAQTAQQDAQRPVTKQVVEHDTAQQTGHHSLAHVKQDHAQRVLGAVGAVEVGQSGVTAAVLPHVITDNKMADHHGAVETAQKIAQQQQNEP